MYKNGIEFPDDTPIAIPFGCDQPESLAETIKRLVRNEVSMLANDAGHETFTDANDFDVDDDGEMVSPYELTQMQEEVPLDYKDEPSKVDPSVPTENGGGKESPPPAPSGSNGKVKNAAPRTPRKQGDLSEDGGDGGVE